MISLGSVILEKIAKSKSNDYLFDLADKARKLRDNLLVEIDTISSL